MNLISFIKGLPKQDDNGIKDFLDIAKLDSNFPNSSDPIKLAQYLYLQLSPDETLGFQKMLMIYTQSEPSNQVPPKYKNNNAPPISIGNSISMINGSKTDSNCAAKIK